MSNKKSITGYSYNYTELDEAIDYVLVDDNNETGYDYFHSDYGHPSELLENLYGEIPYVLAHNLKVGKTYQRYWYTKFFEKNKLVTIEDIDNDYVYFVGDSDAFPLLAYLDTWALRYVS